jgi:hypothetical protein
MEINQSGRLKMVAKNHTYADYFFWTLSYIFHPVFLILWTTAYLLYMHPMVFIGFGEKAKMLVLLRIAGTSVFLPMMTVFLLKGLGFISSIKLPEQKDRIVPYVACITFFFWSYYVSKKLDDPYELRVFLLALFLTASASLIINNYIKISMHATGLGGVNALFVMLLMSGRLHDGFMMTASFLLAGLVCAGRIRQKNHHPAEIYTGYFTGAIILLFAWWFLS